MRTRRSTRLGFQPPAIGEEEIEAVAATLRSGWLTTGPRAALLEERMGGYLEAEHVLAVASGTAALHLALLALGVGPGDEVITSPITWPATANVIEHCGAYPSWMPPASQWAGWLRRRCNPTAPPTARPARQGMGSECRFAA